MTQYLTQVNEMPPQVQTHLERAMREFMWSGKAALVSLEMLQAPRSEGGKNLLDIKARNDALQLMKLKSYLELDPEKRPDWAGIFDKRLEKLVTQDSRADTDALGNMFLQTWKANETKWPQRHKGMLKTAKKYGVKFDTLNPSNQIQGSLPLWHHAGGDPEKTQYPNSKSCCCLRQNHVLDPIH
ncbi:hypothetical protein C8R46DRAFT_918855 [Mycena filopes]|nr:hypothetical protein C8R46DRAFT_918855 [Mycena filopes]